MPCSPRPFRRFHVAAWTACLLAGNPTPAQEVAPQPAVEQPKAPNEANTETEPEPTVDAPQENEPLPLEKWWQAPTVTGDWGGLRTTLEEKGIRASVFLNLQYQGVIHGGLNQNGFRSAGSWDALITADLERLKLIPHADMLLHLQINWGDGINDWTGSAFQVNDDADGDIALHVAQFWYRQRFWEEKAALTLGYLDFQTIIDRNAFSNSEDKQFMHQALDNNPLVPLNIGLGASLRLQPTTWYTLNLGVGDAQSQPYRNSGFRSAFHDEGWWFAYMEHDFQLRFETQAGPLEGNYRTGVIYDPRPRAVFEGPRERFPRAPRGSDYGFYLSFDQMLFRESKDSDQGLGVFGRFSYRTASTNEFARYYSAGLSYKGILPGRDADVLGFAFLVSHVSNDFRRRINRDADRETVYELYYAIQINKWLVVTPDIQYIDNPGASGTNSHTLVTGIRTRISF